MIDSGCSLAWLSPAVPLQQETMGPQPLMSVQELDAARDRRFHDIDVLLMKIDGQLKQVQPCCNSSLHLETCLYPCMHDC